MNQQDFRREVLKVLKTNGPLFVRAYQVSTLPPAADYFNSDATLGFMVVVGVTNETGGATLAFSDGTNWRRVQDRNVVS